MKLIKLHRIIVLVFIMSIFSVSTIDAAHPVLEKFSKRYLKKNKLKKLGKRADRQSVLDIDLESYSIRLQHDVIGMEPSWMIKEKYFSEHYFNLLSTLVVGEYDINPDNGQARDYEAFRAHIDVKDVGEQSKKMHNIIEEADFMNSQLNFLLQVTYSEDYGNNKRFYRSKLLKDEEVYRTFIQNITSHLDTLSSDYKIDNERLGVFVDFNFEDNQSFNDYVEFLHKLRDDIGEGRKIYIVVPAQIKRNYAYNYNQIQELLFIADRLVINATNFDEPKYKGIDLIPSVNFKPNAKYSIKGTLKQYLIPPDLPGRNMSEIADAYMLSDELASVREKFSIILPYYGVGYEIDRKTKRARNLGNITYENFYSFVLGKNEKIRYTTDIIGKNDSIYGVYLTTNPLNGNKIRYYIDDELSLERKYFYIKDSLGIDNVALNALSYYKTTDRVKPMWAILALTYGKEREKLGWIIASFIMGFIPIGFVFSIYKNWEVRNALAKYGNIFTRFNMFFVLFVFLFLTAANIIPRRGVAIVIAIIILGAFFIYIMFKKIMMRSKKYVNIVK